MKKVFASITMLFLMLNVLFSGCCREHEIVVPEGVLICETMHDTESSKIKYEDYYFRIGENESSFGLHATINKELCALVAFSTYNTPFCRINSKKNKDDTLAFVRENKSLGNKCNKKTIHLSIHQEKLAFKQITDTLTKLYNINHLRNISLSSMVSAAQIEEIYREYQKNNSNNRINTKILIDCIKQSSAMKEWEQFVRILNCHIIDVQVDDEMHVSGNREEQIKAYIKSTQLKLK